MANTREILGRIKSIEDTRKITSAMYMISSTKLKRARKNLEDTEPYFYTLQSMISRILRHLPDMEHMYFDKGREVSEAEKKRGIIVITADKGLAGAYNQNVLKLVHEWLEKGKQNFLFVVGELGRQHFLGQGVPVEEHFHYTAQNPTMHRARMISGRVLSMFESGELDEVWLAFTYMINGMQTEPQLMKLLPLERADFKIEIPLDVYQEEFKMLPSPQAVMQNVVPNFVKGYIYGALVESYCSEHNARMMAMQAATNSANDMIKSLSMVYNRARQSAITQEITEVIAGAKAQKKKKQLKKKKEGSVR